MLRYTVKENITYFHKNLNELRSQLSSLIICNAAWSESETLERSSLPVIFRKILNLLLTNSYSHAIYRKYFEFM